jgi:hypothetical protein
MNSARAFPLQWPSGWARTPTGARRRAKYKVTPDRATSELIHSLGLLGVARGSLVLSTNIPLRNDGLPYANARPPEDPGVAVYWTTKAHGERVIACDRWLEVHENIRAIGLAVEGLRQIERAGASQILERAFTAFGELPPAPDAPKLRPWWEVLNFPESLLGALSVPVVEARYRELATQAHPDHGGSTAAFAELSQARDAARKHYEAS